MLVVVSAPEAALLDPSHLTNICFRLPCLVLGLAEGSKTQAASLREFALLTAQPGGGASGASGAAGKGRAGANGQSEAPPPGTLKVLNRLGETGIRK